MQHLGRRGEALVNFENAEKLYRSVFASQEKKFGAKALLTLSALGNVAVALYHQEKYSEAEEIDRRVLSLHNELQDPDDQVTLSTAYNLASYYQAQQKHQEAVDILEPLVEMGSDSRAMIISLLMRL